MREHLWWLISLSCFCLFLSCLAVGQRSRSAGVCTDRKVKSGRTCLRAAAGHRFKPRGYKRAEPHPANYAETCPDPFFPAVSWNLSGNLGSQYAAG